MPFSLSVHLRVLKVKLEAQMPGQDENGGMLINGQARPSIEASPRYLQIIFMHGDPVPKVHKGFPAPIMHAIRALACIQRGSWVISKTRSMAPFCQANITVYVIKNHHQVSGQGQHDVGEGKD